MLKTHQIHILTTLSIALLTLLALIFLLFFSHNPILSFIKIAPELLGKNEKKHYLILFQNNAELRPGGGFIGAYGVITINKGKIQQLTIHNTYDADGQLKKHIEPYYISRRYLQAHLYMRDSNFDVDFVKSAQKVAYMLQQETGEKVDGVIAIDLNFVENLIKVIQPVYVWQYNLNITANNFFTETEYHTDKYSFPGSTQKQDFLRALSEGIQTKFQTNIFLNSFKSLQKIREAIPQKHLLVVIFNPEIQNILTQNHFSSALYDPRRNEPNTVNDFLGINEANIGVNKTNYFIRRSVADQVNFNKTGAIQEKLTITYTNTAGSENWPGGKYKTYIRLIVPSGTKLQNIIIDKKTQKIIPAITNYHQYEASGFQSPSGLEVDHTQEEGKTLYGFVLTVDIKTTKKVTISYQLPYQKNTNLPQIIYNLYLFKQPGTKEDPYTFTVRYPNTYQASQNKIFTHLVTDQSYKITFTKKRKE